MMKNECIGLVAFMETGRSGEDQISCIMCG
jgi:hypothetical protein